MNENKCVVCGESIPEGGQICFQCEREFGISWGDRISEKVYQKGFENGQFDILQALIEHFETQEESGLKEMLRRRNERKQGHWLVYRSAVKCSECRAFIPQLTQKPEFLYCPHCGAKMSGE